MRRGQGGVTCSALCIACGRRFTARTTTVAEQQVEEHLHKGRCPAQKKPKAPKPESGELFK